VDSPCARARPVPRSDLACARTAPLLPVLADRGRPAPCSDQARPRRPVCCLLCSSSPCRAPLRVGRRVLSLLASYFSSVGARWCHSLEDSRSPRSSVVPSTLSRRALPARSRKRCVCPDHKPLCSRRAYITPVVTSCTLRSLTPCLASRLFDETLKPIDCRRTAAVHGCLRYLRQLARPAALYTSPFRIVFEPVEPRIPNVRQKYARSVCIAYQVLDRRLQSKVVVISCIIKKFQESGEDGVSSIMFTKYSTQRPI
jgi:hypothetical protein